MWVIDAGRIYISYFSFQYFSLNVVSFASDLTFEFNWIDGRVQNTYDNATIVGNKTV